MEDIVQYCKYEKQINLESFISDMRSKIKKLYETEYNYSGRKKVKIGVKKLIQLFYLRNEGEPRLKCIGLFQNCLDDYFENFKKCKQECMVNITRLRDEDIKQHVGTKKPRPAKEGIQKSDSLNLSAREKYEGNEANRQIADTDEPNLVVADRNEINIKVADRNESNLEAANRKKANIEVTDTKKANLEAADINEPNFVVADRNEINLKVVDRNKAKLEAADRKKANLEATDINEPNFEATDINETNLVVADRNEINLRVADRNEANLEAADRKKANLKAADRKKANLEVAVRNETNFEITDRNESSNSSNLIPFVYEGNISTTNSDDENALNKKREKHLRPHIVSKNNKLQDGCNEVLNEVYSDFLNMVFPKRKSEDIVSKKLADIDDNNTCESNNNNDKNLITRKSVEVSVKITSDVITPKTSSAVCTNDIKAHVPPSVISMEQIDGNLQKEKKLGHFSAENDIGKKNSEYDIDEITDKMSSRVCKKDNKDMSSRVISIEQTGDNLQKERKLEYFSAENDVGKKGSKHDIEEILDSKLQKSSSLVCKNDIKDKSSRIISVGQTEKNLEKERKSRHLSTENDIEKECSKQDIDEISDSTLQKTSVVCKNDISMSTKVSVEQTDDSMQKERKSGDISTENDIGKEGIKHDIDEISDNTSQKSFSVVCKNDIKEKSSRIISVEPTENNLEERKSGHLRTENDIGKEGIKQDIGEISDSTSQKTLSEVCQNDIINMSTKVSGEQTDDNMQKERKSGHISTENDIGKEGIKHDIDEISDSTSQKSSSVVCKNDIKDKSSRIISVESTENNLQKERKSRHISTENDIGEEGSKQDIDEISVCTSQKTLSEVCQNDIIHMSSEVISVEQTGDNLQNEKKSGYLSTENDIGKEGSKQDIDEISFSTSQKMSVVCKNDVIDMSSKVSIEQTDDNMQKERKSGHFSSENDTGKEGIKHDIHEFSDSTSQKTCLIVCKEDIKDKSSKVISVEQTDSNLKKKRKLEDFNIKNAIRKKRSKNETFLQYDIDKQEIVKKTEISDIASEKTSSVLCENDIEEVVLPRVISVEQKDDNRQKKRKREDNRDNISQRLADSSKELRIATNKRPRLVTGNDTEHYAPSICYYQGNQNSQKERKFVKLNKDNFLSAKNVDMEFRYFLNAVVINNSITVNILCLGDQNEIVLTERNDSKFISDGDEKSVTKIYEFFFNFKKSTSPRRPCRSTSHSISSDVTSQSTDSPRIIYRSEISIFIPDGQMPSRKDCIDYLTKHWYEFVNKTSEKRLLKKCVLKTAAGASKDKDLSEELRTRKQEDGMSAILRPFGYERKSMESESSDKHEVLKREKQKVIHEKLRLSSKSIPAEDEIRVSVGRSQNSMPSIDLNENKSIFSKRSKHPDKSKEMSSVNLSSLGYDRFHYGSYVSPDEEVTPEPVVQNKKQLFHVIEDLLKKFNIDDNEAQPFHPVPSRREFTIDEDQILDLNFTPVHNNLFGSFEKVLSASIDGPDGQNHAKSSHSSDPIWHNYAKSPYDSACHGYEETFDAASEDSYESEDSDAFSLCSDPYSVFDNGPFNLLKECGGSSSDDDVW